MFFCCPLDARATVAPGSAVVARKAAHPPPNVADFSDPIWATAVRASAFENLTSRVPSRFATTVYLLYDDVSAYVGFDCDQHGVPLTQTQGTNDVGYGLDDSVSVAFDTSGNNSRTYAFTATPLGVRYEFSTESSRYQPPWTVVTKRTATGYRVLMTIPLATMRLQGRVKQRWRVNFTRRIAASNDNDSWAYDAASNGYCQNSSLASTLYCDPTRWPVLAGIDLPTAIKPPPPYADVYALASLGGDRKIFETTPGSFTSLSPRVVGLDATVPFTRTLAFVGALGPDFSNVETDQTTISPQEFQQHFTEYRPFFAEGSNYVQALPTLGIIGTGNTMFYTPSLGVLDSGFKIEGTQGTSAIGLLDANGDGYDDRAFGYSSAKPDGSLTLSAQGVSANHAGVRDTTIGIGGDYQNVHSGIQPLFTYQAESGTNVARTRDAREFVGAVVVDRGPWHVGGAYQDVGPEFAPIDGYTTQNDTRGPAAFAIYNGVGGKRGAIKSFGATAVVDRFVDRSGAARQADALYQVKTTLKNLASLALTSQTSELRTYAEAFPTYAAPANVAFDQNEIQVGYRDGTPTFTDASYTIGRFAVVCPGTAIEPLACPQATNGFVPAFTRQLDLSTTRALRDGLSVTFEFAGTSLHPDRGAADSQWLRRLSLSRALGSDSQLALSLRAINGTGGFALPGEDLAVSFHERFRNQNQLYVEYGSPASYRTLQRFIFKYVVHLGKGGAGT